MQAVTTDNILDMDFDEMRAFCFGLIKGHEDKIVMDVEFMVTRLGEYPALFQYFSELYTFMVGKVREAQELRDTFRKMRYMDKRDCLEQVLKTIKFQYDALSRKVTVLDVEGD